MARLTEREIRRHTHHAHVVNVYNADPDAARRGVARNEGQDTSRRRGKRRRVRRMLRTSSRCDGSTGVIFMPTCLDDHLVVAETVVSWSRTRDSASGARFSRRADLPRFITDTNRSYQPRDASFAADAFTRRPTNLCVARRPVVAVARVASSKHFRDTDLCGYHDGCHIGIPFREPPIRRVRERRHAGTRATASPSEGAARGLQ